MDGLGINDLSRQPSLRQQEKAPEGRPPHAAQEAEPSVQAASAGVDQSPEAGHENLEELEREEGVAPPESRFTEEL